MTAFTVYRGFAAAIALTSLCACGGATLTRVVEADARLPRAIELEATPFFPQVEYQCGPAALATVLAATGVAVTPDDLVTKVFVPKLEGSLQTEMIAAARGYDRLAYRVAPDMSALLATLADRQPVLVLQNLGIDAVPFWHYAVVVGFDSEREQVVLRSGTDRRLTMSARRFADTWRRARYWGIAAVSPGEIPASAPKASFIEAAAGLESAGRLEAALIAYQAAAQRWPDDPVPILGLGNVHYRQRALAAAEEDFRRVLALDPGHAIARNNLAQTLLELGRSDEALREIEAAQAALTDSRFAQALAETESAIRAARAERRRAP
jgi:tetratricopeptide (TPR) repeat protein